MKKLFLNVFVLCARMSHSQVVFFDGRLEALVLLVGPPGFEPGTNTL